MAPRSGPALLRWAIRAVALGGVPLLLSGAVLLVQRDPSRYVAMLREDGPVEWLTFTFLILAALAAFAACAGRRRLARLRFLAVAGVLCFVGAHSSRRQVFRLRPMRALVSTTTRRICRQSTCQQISRPMRARRYTTTTRSFHLAICIELTQFSSNAKF